ncbi:cytochrome c oxidase polypeptide II [Bacillus sp. JCM 19045]|uniref:Cytochrome c oxidase subunit 2 n=1 Tax=Shouchella xiaoxiensis TaxID=766895 RepID=A0ABS2SPT2_9BACI|nr:cytochrome c oxidase subunit II [Shouchella xiaoxiensis]MBM7837520.1 cytochrome c oxidase subunit 2 [Shouchella xiaoxiensis]GAF14637.1 cytochrome c oxidase polypeptide II [Bacillus sp. JCM 19045]
MFKNHMWRLTPAVLLLVFLSGCFGEENLTALDPKGEAAQWIYDNMILSLVIMTFVSVVVFAIFFIIVVKFRRKDGDDELPKQVHGNTAMEITWTVIPVLLLVILFVPTVTGTFDFHVDADPSEHEDSVYINVTGHQYWWQFDYEEGFTAGQEVYIPVGERVIFELNAEDVIHSFWVPALGGKIDNIPGVSNALWLEAKEPGVYLGKCAELCGPSHALMDFKVIALERDDYDAWVEDMTAVEAEETAANAEAGYEVFQENSCIACHAVGGQGMATGPTLTNFGDRQKFAGVYDIDDDEKLAQWIKDPQSLKQGNNMPAHPDISDEDMADLIDYLRSLQVRPEGADY